MKKSMEEEIEVRKVKKSMEKEIEVREAQIQDMRRRRAVAKRGSFLFSFSMHGRPSQRRKIVCRRCGDTQLSVAPKEL